MSEAYRYMFDPVKLKAAMRPYLIDAMIAAGDELLRCMKINVHTITAVGRTMKGAPGDPEWRNEVDRDLRKLYEDYADKYLEVGIGADYAEGTPEQVRAMVIAYGAGSAAGNPPIHAGPEGRSVWNDGLTGKTESRAQSEYDLPDGFNQEGNDFIRQAIKDTEEKFNQILQSAVKNMPSSVWQGAMIRR